MFISNHSTEVRVCREADTVDRGSGRFRSG